MPPVFRFAPSPNGYLHLGHALSALLNADMATREEVDECCCASRISIRPAAGLEYEGGDLRRSGVARTQWEAPGAAAIRTLGRLPCRPADLDAMGLIYPSFESRAEIARLVADREAQASWPRDPGRRAALSRSCESSFRLLNESAAWNVRRPLRFATGYAGGAQARRAR